MHSTFASRGLTSWYVDLTLTKITACFVGTGHFPNFSLEVFLFYTFAISFQLSISQFRIKKTEIVDCYFSVVKSDIPLEPLFHSLLICLFREGKKNMMGKVLIVIFLSSHKIRQALRATTPLMCVLIGCEIYKENQRHLFEGKCTSSVRRTHLGE